MGSAMAARPARRDEVTTGDLAEGDKATAAATKNTGAAAAPVTRRRMQRRKAKHKSKTSGPGGVTLLNEPFTPKDSGKPLSAARAVLLSPCQITITIAIDIGQPNPTT